MDSLQGELDCSCAFAFGCATVFQDGGALLLFLKWGLMESRLPQNSLLAVDDLPRVIETCYQVGLMRYMVGTMASGMLGNSSANPPASPAGRFSDLYPWTRPALPRKVATVLHAISG